MEQTPRSGAAGLLSRRSLFGMAAGGGVAAVLGGCSTPARGAAVPMDRTIQASVLGLPNERFFPLYGTAPLEVEFAAAADRLRRAQGLAPNAPLPEVQLLAVSGGGENGAFGAGLLCGWSEHGDRPVFELVTGVSTGALTAPFAYLGSSYDPQLRAVYTQLTVSGVLLKRYVTAALFDDAMTDNSRKLARRRAGVSVVSSTFSIRRDRCSASDLSIARRSRSSISSLKCPRPVCDAWPREIW